MTTAPLVEPTDVNTVVASNLRALFARDRWSGRAAAMALGVTPMYVSRRLNGSTHLDAGDLVMFATFLKVPVASLFVGTGAPADPSWSAADRARDDLARGRVLTLGEALRLRLVSSRVSMKRAHEHISGVVGPIYGAAADFEVVLDSNTFSELDDAGKARAWILSAALGLEAGSHGVADTAMPAAFDLSKLRRALLLPEMDSNHQPADSETAAHEHELASVTRLRPRPSTGTTERDTPVAPIAMLVVNQ